MADVALDEAAPVSPALSTESPKTIKKEPKKKKKKEPTPANKPVGSSTRELIMQFVSTCSDRKGVSSHSIKKAIAAQGFERKATIHRTLAKLVESGELVQVTGAWVGCGSFKIAKPAPVKKSEKTAAKKTAAKKSKAAKTEATTGKKTLPREAAKKSSSRAKK